MIIQEPVQAAIKHALDHYAYLDAIFLAERLYAEVATDDALYLLATCYYRSGNTFSAYSVLHTKGCHTSQCRFLLARCCADLKKYSEAELALTGCSIAKTKGSEDVASEFGNSGAFAVQLLGDVLGKTERYPKAAEAYRKSLWLNPFLWSSYEALVNLGERPEPSKVFSFANIENFSTVQGSNPLITLLNNSTTGSNSLPSDLLAKEDSSQLPSKVPSSGPSFNIHSPIALLRSSEQANLEVWTPDNSQWMPVGQTVKSKLAPRMGRTSTCHSVCTPSFGILPLMETPSPASGVVNLTDSSLTHITPTPSSLIDNISNEPHAPKKEKLGLRRSQAVNPPKFQIFSQSSNNSSNNVSQSSSPQSGRISPGQGNVVRRSSRLFSNSNSVKENNKGANKSLRFVTSKTASKKSKSRLLKTSSSKESELNELNKPEIQENKSLEDKAVSVSQAAVNMQKASAEGLMGLLVELGKVRLYLGQYNCKKAIEIMRSLPSRHFHTGWVLVTLARAHFEQAEYEKAVLYFQEVRQLEPHRLEGMEYYSTALWHIQQEVALSTLAQELTEMAKEAPQTWCVSGNCFSLQKEHETAIKFLQRAVQVDPEFAYAYTLLGHEHVLTEEMDRAMACFRSAIRIDPRHYNAWYGVGMIYYKQEKFHLAEVHFKRALNINPQSSVLMVHIGVVQHALKKTDASLATLNKAMQMDPKNPLCKFHRASIYFSLDRHQEALRELEDLKEIVPKESLVFFLIGKVHKKLGNTHLALMNFSWAMDLDPKGANNQIKEAIDKRYTNDEEEVLATSHDPVIDDVSGISLGQADLESSHDSSVMDTEEAHLQLMESDDSF